MFLDSLTLKPAGIDDYGVVHYTVVMDVPEIIGLYNVKSILTDNSI